MYITQIITVVSLLLGTTLAYDPHFAARRDALSQRRNTLSQRRDTGAIHFPAADWEPHFGPPSRRHLMSSRDNALMQKLRAQQTRDMHNRNIKKECTKVADCQCKKKFPNSKSESCMNGKCYCGAANDGIAKVEEAFAKPVLEGLAIAGKELQKVVGGMEFAVKMALSMASWAIPGLGKQAVKILSDAIPLSGTGDKKADEIMKIIAKVL